MIDLSPEALQKRREDTKKMRDDQWLVNSPDAVIAMIDEIERLRSEVKSLRTTIEHGFSAAIFDTINHLHKDLQEIVAETELENRLLRRQLDWLAHALGCYNDCPAGKLKSSDCRQTTCCDCWREAARKAAQSE